MGTLDRIGRKIDAGLDEADLQKLDGAIDQIDQLLADPAHQNQSILHYFRANAFAGRWNLNRASRRDQFEWKQPDLSEETLSLRRAIKCSSFGSLDRIRRCQILTNLGNSLNKVGRPVEAIAAWDEALAIEPSFAMAAANRANGLSSYSAALYDPGHQCIVLKCAADSLRSALDNNAVWESIYPDTVKNTFQSKLQKIELYLSRSCSLGSFDPYDFELGRDVDAKAFSQWRLDNRLFLNPLNDLGPWPVAAQDIFHLPDHTYDVGDDPSFVRYFDFIKQEYVAACVILYEGVDRDIVHPADRTLLTFEHADYSVASVEIEKQKAAFRMAYSLFDKCGVFINDYFELGLDPRSFATSFRKVWFCDPKKGVLNPSLPTKNWRLRGLYSLSLDLFDKDLKELSSPLAVKANDVRNAAEHRFISVHDLGKPSEGLPLCEYVTTKEMFELALHILKLSRAAIMGLSLAVHHQENHLKKPARDSLVVPLAFLPKERWQE
jgi:tetratricopeptide (TPR) repeat protein